MRTTIALFGSLLGAYLNAIHNILGFYVWIFANILWFTDSVKRRDKQQSILWIYYIIICFVGIFTWRKII